ncbi:hypothetical protein BI330_08540 [Mycobacterium sp. CBMA 623]|nr:hypothetical protein [Mycobacteroides sp. CBMA 326]
MTRYSRYDTSATSSSAVESVIARARVRRSPRTEETIGFSGWHAQSGIGKFSHRDQQLTRRSERSIQLDAPTADERD